jgi:archaellum biogenesis ATPase FlaH
VKLEEAKQKAKLLWKELIIQINNLNERSDLIEAESLSRVLKSDNINEIKNFIDYTEELISLIKEANEDK